ncbi:hypothetical protein [uncultured Bacteroides sp.]|uniref:hypothetical protein n=1 Tax=uncultured Bacteroides sp. TaxID=162156 RepID=UPI0025EA64FE|nr:hypothetical protein [uncultured Bacteroides sp.]
MRTELLSITFVLFLFIGCDKNDYDEIKLSQTSVNVSLNTEYTVSITKGSGSYSSEIENPEIADISIETEQSEQVLSIIPRKEGETIITVIDNKSGKVATCSLKASKRSTSLTVIKIQYAIDAEQKETIEAELKKNPPATIGSSYIFTYDTHQIDVTVIAPDNTPINHGSLITNSDNDYSKVPSIYRILPIEEQIYNYQKWEIDFGNNKQVYDAFIVAGPVTRNNIVFRHHRLYQDLTEIYKTKYPTAGVKGVVIAQICRSRNNYN